MRVIIIMIFLIFSPITLGKAQESNITIQKALELSNIEARKLNYNIERMEIRIVGKTITWEELRKHHWYFKDFKDDNNGLEKKLHNKCFWLVYYLPIKKGKDIVIFGDDLWVFIENPSGRILTTVRGK
ncbi:MAG: hypothetical protein WAV76_01665 [Bacteroidota bacterium]